MADLRGFTEEDGHQLAADLIRALEEQVAIGEEAAVAAAPNDEAASEAVCAAWRNNVDGIKILRRHLATVRKARSPELERGFLAVLVDKIGAECPADVEFYERGGRDG